MLKICAVMAVVPLLAFAGQAMVSDPSHLSESRIEVSAYRAGQTQPIAMAGTGHVVAADTVAFVSAR